MRQSPTDALCFLVGIDGPSVVRLEPMGTCLEPADGPNGQFAGIPRRDRLLDGDANGRVLFCLGLLWMVKLKLSECLCARCTADERYELRHYAC